ncbi:bifunctional folylpolyglutamate synthase/dihydrofolate synthase [Erysipelothrix sp. HDW6C]|uniref:bifunctional folylpolyglutamate synthase/dihydrofolate synthase n=1 Tax=Erysipelothrix sp. HDW6C TaxID=2714930 RepID=UPI00140BE7F5|nr:folylpolyglutamate synthase/dihydrofolate synthase family protein [Erysipelothrix sp. HDW6C]QIK68853.1 bifunctional folylpolyglutamate synthase/dihydrofolate synthase [Erysipelothrix sp. HDW6C]
MFKTIDEALDVVMSRRNQTYGIALFKQALESLGNPQDALRIIHIGGTNGKGSTTNYVRTILQTAGYSVGSFTSPHLVKHNDRIRINNREIDDETFLNYINKTLPLWDAYTLSMFEIDMLISILYFKDNRVDYVVYEVGLGGRLDATNVVTPLVSAITNVGFDHQGILGNTITEIACEKAGIIKPNVPLITTISGREAMDVVIDKVYETHSRLKQICVPYYHTEGQAYIFHHEGMDIRIENQGAYQVGNAALAVSIVREILPTLEDSIIQEGVLHANWPGRFEEVLPRVYLDGAHNEMGIRQLVESMQILPKPWIVVFTALKDKDHSEMIEDLVGAFDTVIVTEFSFYRAASAEELAFNHDVITIPNYQDAIRYGQEHQTDGTLIITGSLYFISEVRALLKGEKND